MSSIPPNPLNPPVFEIPDPAPEFGQDGGKFYRHYDALAQEIDDDMTSGLKEQLDGIFAFPPREFAPAAVPPREFASFAAHLENLRPLRQEARGWLFVWQIQILARAEFLNKRSIIEFWAREYDAYRKEPGFELGILDTLDFYLSHLRNLDRTKLELFDDIEVLRLVHPLIRKIAIAPTLLDYPTKYRAVFQAFDGIVTAVSEVSKQKQNNARRFRDLDQCCCHWQEEPPSIVTACSLPKWVWDVLAGFDAQPARRLYAE